MKISHEFEKMKKKGVFYKNEKKFKFEKSKKID